MTRRLIVNADDFGASASINRAVARAHDEGILTSASLLVNGGACDDAVALARQRPTLGVGLHLALVRGKASPGGLGDASGNLPGSPVSAGLAYFFDPRLRPKLEQEIAAQFARFHATGLALDHVNGHLNLHLHPTVFRILMEGRERWGIRAFRCVRDPLRLNARLARGRWGYRLTHALVFGALARRARPVLERHGIRHADHVFGLLQNGAVSEAFVLRLLDHLPPGDTELYAHPCEQSFPHELAALTSPRVKQRLDELGIRRIRHADLQGR